MNLQGVSILPLAASFGSDFTGSRRGITVFVTTHFMDEAEYCDRISIMVDGVIRTLDTPDRLKRQFGADTMDDVFQQLAREAVRTAD